MQATTEFYFLAGTTRWSQVRIRQIIRWHAPPNPNIKLNTNGSSLGNPSIASVGGILRDHLGRWIADFSLHLGLAKNNMAELATVPQGLAMAWNLDFNFIQLEHDSKVVLTWLTNDNASYPTNMMPLICDCRLLMDRDWEVQVLHVYRKANDYADVLAKRGAHQQHILSVYSSCPSFVYICYVRDLAGLGTQTQCATNKCC